MQPSALGLTCKDALHVFSHNETLALQRRVAELEARVAELEAQREAISSAFGVNFMWTEDDWHLV